MATLARSMPQFLVLVAIGAAFFFIALGRFRKTINEMA
jgi:hypothetical protein